MIDTGYWWAFVLLTPILYWLLPEKIRATVLSVLSFGLLAYFAPTDILSLAALSGLVYLSHAMPEGRTGLTKWVSKIGKSTAPLWVVIVYFVWNKYLPSLLLVLGHQASFLDLAIPIGISYFTFKLLHYSIERRRGSLPAHHFADFLSYLFLPQIFTAGPIERFDHFLAHRSPKFEWAFVEEGLLRIAQGLVKKFVFATTLSNIVSGMTGGGFEAMANNIDNFAAWQIWTALFLELAYTYFDFSGYCDIAIGASRLLGFKIMENFNMPFLATNLQKFWQRWHMTLAAWVLAYVYMPLVAQTRNPYVAIIAAFIVIGLWHAAWPAHWLIWGVWHGVGLAALIGWNRWFKKRRSKFLERPGVKAGGWAITMFYVALGDVFPTFYGSGSLLGPLVIIRGAFGLP